MYYLVRCNRGRLKHCSAEDLSAGGSEEVRHFAGSTGQRLYDVAFRPPAREQKVPLAAPRWAQVEAITAREPDWQLFRSVSTAGLALCKRMLDKEMALILQ